MFDLRKMLAEEGVKMRHAADTARVLFESGECDLLLAVYDAAELHGVDKNDLLIMVKHSDVVVS